MTRPLLFFFLVCLFYKKERVLLIKKYSYLSVTAIQTVINVSIQQLHVFFMKKMFCLDYMKTFPMYFFNYQYIKVLLTLIKSSAC